MQVFLHIVGNNIVPIFILIAFGYMLSRYFPLDIFTLSKLNFYIFVPIFVFVNLYSTTIEFELIQAVLFTLLLLSANMLVGSLLARVRGYDLALKNAFKNSIMFYNSGNIGVPLITLVFSSSPYIVDGQTPYLFVAVATQVMVLVVQNVTTNTIGFFNAGRAQMDWRESIAKIFRMPTVYAIPVALVLKALPIEIANSPIWPALQFVRQGLIPLALITLGVQLSRTTFDFGDKEVFLAVFTRLIGGPILAIILLMTFRLDGILAQTLMISSAVPTSVNSALIAVEYRNRPDFASQAVMLSTLLSALTLTGVISAARIIFPI